MSKISLQESSPVASVANAGTKHVPAVLVLIAGTAASLLFGRDRVEPPTSQVVAGEGLVRRVQPPRAETPAATTQLLGYAEEEARDVGVQVGGFAPIEPRTSARIDTNAAGREMPSYGRLSPTVVTAAAGPPPRAVMRPYATSPDPATTPAAKPIGASLGGGSLSAVPANAPRRHRILDGDTLVGLAERYYGDAARYRDIFEANRGTLHHPELLPIGATLEIPGYDPQQSRPIAPPAAARLVPQVLYRSP